MIKAIVALVESRAVEFGTLAFIGVVLDRSTPRSFADFEKAVQKVPECAVHDLALGTPLDSERTGADTPLDF